ncbi:MAG: hypothetical protein RL095_98 [Verrucomicrobiota bacterium]|jgi:gluconolactonase
MRLSHFVFTVIAGYFASCAPFHAEPMPEICREEILAEGLKWGEGPCLLPDGRLIFADIPAKRVLSWSPAQGLQTWRESEGLANGHALSPDGGVAACEEGARRIVWTDFEGRSLKILAAKDKQGRRLNSPNDLCFSPAGRLYFSDPTFGIRGRPELKEQERNSVFSCLSDGSDLRRETGEEMQLPNGLAFAPGGKILYVIDSGRGRILSYELYPDGSLGRGRFFCTVENADGLRVDRRGRVYIAEKGGLTLRWASGAEICRLPIAGGATNLCFGDDIPSVLYVTSPGSCRRLELKWR